MCIEMAMKVESNGNRFPILIVNSQKSQALIEWPVFTGSVE